MSGGEGMAEAAGEADAGVGGTWRDHVLYCLGLAVPFLLVWLASIRFLEPWPVDLAQAIPSMGPATYLFLLPATYLAVWQILFARNIRHGLIGAFATTLVIGLGFAVFPIGGFIIFALLFLPIGLLGIALLAHLLSRFYNETGPDGRSVNLGWVHLWLGFLALIGLYIVRAATPPLPGVSFWGLLAIGGFHFLPFLPHATLTWIALNRSSRRPTIPFGRVASLVALALALPALVLATMAPPWAALTWPVRIANHLSERHTEQTLRWQRHIHGGHLQSGESQVFELDGATLTARIPQGWLGPDPRHHPPHVVMRGLILRPVESVPGVPGNPVRSIRIVVRPNLGTLLPIGASVELREGSIWIPIGCAPASPAWAGATVCRATVWFEYDGPSPSDLARLPDAQLPIRASYSQSAGSGAYYMFGRAFRAVCTRAHGCAFVFPLANGAAVTVFIAERDAPRWREIRDIVDTTVRTAIGVGLSDAPMVLQPEGDLLQIGGRP